MSRQAQESKIFDRYFYEIEQSYSECFHTGQFFSGEFNSSLLDIWKDAKNDGLGEEDFQDIVEEVVHQYLDLIYFPFSIVIAA